MRYAMTIVLLAVASLPLAAQDTNLSQVLLPGEDWQPAKGSLPATAAKTSGGWTYSLVGQAVQVTGSDGQQRKVADGIGSPSALALSPDGGTLVVADGAGKHLFAFRVEPDGGLTCREGYGTMQLPYGVKASGAAGMTVDNAGRYYVSTPVGIQMFDATCRLVGIMRSPTKPGPLAFGGPAGDVLYIGGGDQVFARKTKAQGVKP